MAEFTGIPYIKIIASAAIPAILYIIWQWEPFAFEAKKLGLKVYQNQNCLTLGKLWNLRDIYLFLSNNNIFLVAGFTPYFSAFWAIVISVGIAILAA